MKEISQKTIEGNCAFWFSRYMKNLRVLVDSIEVTGPDKDGDFWVTFRTKSVPSKKSFFIFGSDLKSNKYNDYQETEE